MDRNNHDSKSQNRRIIAAAIVGTVLEVYDWVLLGTFAVPISRTFFPTSSPAAAILMTLATLAVGVIVRPLGATIIGRYADRTGRRKALSLTLLLMGLGILISAACPGYATIGIAAPIIMVIGRVLQGLSAGGEMGCSLTVLVEAAPPKQRRFLAALQPASQSGGVIIAGLVGLTLSLLFTEAQIQDGAWRIAFILGLSIVPIGVYLRRSISDEAEGPAHASHESTWRQAVKHRGALIYSVFIVLFWTVGTYASTYFPVYIVHELGMKMSSSYAGQLTIGVVGVIAGPLIGLLAERVGTRIPMLIGSIATAALAYPMIKYLTINPTLGSLLAVQALQMLLLMFFAAGASSEIAELFPKEFRATGTSVSYTAAVTIFGGLSPLIITLLIEYTGNKSAFGVYLAAAALISTVAILCGRSGNRTTTQSDLKMVRQSK